MTAAGSDNISWPRALGQKIHIERLHFHTDLAGMAASSQTLAEMPWTIKISPAFRLGGSCSRKWGGNISMDVSDLCKVSYGYMWARYWFSPNNSSSITDCTMVWVYQLVKSLDSFVKHGNSGSWKHWSVDLCVWVARSLWCDLSWVHRTSPWWVYSYGSLSLDLQHISGTIVSLW